MSDITVYGAPWCPDCRRTKRFLAEQRIPYDWVDIDADEDGRATVERLQNGGRTIPTVVFTDGGFLVDPEDSALAARLGIETAPKRRMYDLAVIGGGPAGLAASIYAAREGIECVVIDGGGLGGQAGVTERIDNYPGFPDGIPGAELADRFIAQARRYGVELLAATMVTAISKDGDDVCVTLSGGAEIAAHAAIIATGSTYRRLEVPGEDDLIGAGVHFCATCDGPFYRGSDLIAVIGGGNSAVEEALFLTQFAAKVVILQRGDELTASRLLKERALGDPRLEVRSGVEVVALRGAGRLEAIDIRVRATGEEMVLRPAAAFVFIGLDPNTEFLRGGPVTLDSRGFIPTDDAFATSLAGVYAAGDVRVGSTKQLGSAVGDGIAALLAVRRHLERHQHICAPDVEDAAPEVAAPAGSTSAPAP